MQQATGIYECYCTKYLGPGNFWEIWTNPELEICGHYAADLFGGKLMTLPSGITNAIMTNVGTLLVLKLVPKIGIQSYNTQLYLTVFSIFAISYTNMGLILLWNYKN